MSSACGEWFHSCSGTSERCSEKGSFPWYLIEASFPWHNEFVSTLPRVTWQVTHQYYRLVIVGSHVFSFSRGPALEKILECNGTQIGRRERPGVEKCRQTLAAWKRRGNRFSSRASRRKTALLRPRFCPVRCTWTSSLQNYNKVYVILSPWGCIHLLQQQQETNTALPRSASPPPLHPAAHITESSILPNPTEKF